MEQNGPWFNLIGSILLSLGTSYICVTNCC
jgi:hypothetical protein